MKNIKLIALVILLVGANLYVSINIAFDIKYRVLIESYNHLSDQYEELEEKYLAQEEKLQEVISIYSDDKESISSRIYKALNFDNISLESITDKLATEIKCILKDRNIKILK